MRNAKVMAAARNTLPSTGCTKQIMDSRISNQVQQFFPSLSTEIIDLIRQEGRSVPMRPLVSDSAGTAPVLRLMKACWSEDPSKRPSFDSIKIAFRTIHGSVTSKDAIKLVVHCFLLWQPAQTRFNLYMYIQFCPFRTLH
jgi:hypothetical protein